jgi:predicted lysophospholipase L1 biosynthesis ABC-type transport system permease subunit
VREVALEQAPAAVLYASYRQRPGQAGSFALVVRGPEPTSISATVRRVIHDVSPVTPVEIRTTAGALDTVTGARRFNFWLIGAFGIAALALAAIGVYALVSFTVVQRTREIGIRMALGAEPGSLARLIVQRGVTLALIGAVAGVGIALLLTRTIDGLLFGVTASDPLVHVTVVLVMLGVAVSASAIPARRVLRQTPGRTLREI